MKSRGVQKFGGTWTEKKLEKLRKYLSAYTTIMSKQPSFTYGYIDAFAGTGFRETENTEIGLFPEEKEELEFLKGSAQIALETTPPFKGFIFIERDQEKAQALETLKAAHPDKNIRVVTGDANQTLRELSKADWKKRRAVLFLDPFGLQVDWTTLEAIASTKAIDVWILFPLGVAVNRLLTRSGKIAATTKTSLDRLFGTTDWYDAFYKRSTQQPLFDTDETIEKVVDLEGIATFFNKRLSEIFAAVAPNPLKLKNKTGNPLFLFCFAAANPRGAPTAVKIANHLLKEK